MHYPAMRFQVNREEADASYCRDIPTGYATLLTAEVWVVWSI